MLASSITNGSAQSAAARQLESGFAWLCFNDPLLELSFRQHHIQRSRTRVLLHLWLALALVTTFILIDELLLKRPGSSQLLVLRLLALGSLMTSLLVTATRANYEKYYPRIIRLVVPVFGACAVANAFIAQPQGVSFFAAIVLVLFAVYLLVGLLFVSALFAGVFILAAYLLGALVAEVSTHELIYNGTILLFTNVLGATASYTLEKLVRTSFLEACLLNDMANRDGLTGIHNRRAFDEHTARIWPQAMREQRPVGLLLVDIDHFKAYNDYYGHQVGDQCLQQVAHILLAACRRPLDFTARFGGEEFAIVLYDANAEYVHALAERIHQLLSELNIAHPASSSTRRLTVSIGATWAIPAPERSFFGFLQLADEALYEAKDAGRDCTMINDNPLVEEVTGSFRHASQQEPRRAS